MLTPALRALMAAASVQNAQPAHPGHAASTAEEIVVTGERTTRTLRNTPSSVFVATRPALDAMAAPDRLDQVLALVPNVQLGSGGDAPTIRGQDATGVLRDLPAFLGGARPRATLEVDGRAVTYNEFAFGVAPLWEVDRIEVFRSPQTTTQGRNSIGGAIFIHTADPSNEPEAHARLILGSARTVQVSASVSGPLIDDQVSVLLSGDLRRSRTSSDLRGNISGVDLNRDAYGQYRAKLLAAPSALPGLKLLLTFSITHSSSPQVEGIQPPLHERRDPNVSYGYFRTNVHSLTGTATYDLSPELQERTTVSFGSADIRRFAQPGFGETNIHGRDGSLESVLEWNPSDELRMLGGVHLLSNTLNQRIDLAAAGLGIGDFRDRQKSLGVFGEITLQPVNRVTLVTGLREQEDLQDRTGFVGAATPSSLAYHGRFRAFLPKVSFAYDISHDVRVGALVQRAYNAGGVTIDLRTRGPDTFGAEKLWDYEMFARADLFDHSTLLAANLFYNDIEDAQRQQLQQLSTGGGTVFFSEISNAPAARSYGAEIELRYRRSSRFTASLGVGLLTTRIIRTQSPRDPLLDKAFSRAPRFTGSASVDWLPVPKLRLSADVRHHASYFSDDANTPALRVGPATIVNAKSEWQVGRLSLFGYVRNLFDSFRLTYRFAIMPGPQLVTAEDPREVGVGLEARF